jgi:hypothetical protein
MNEANIGGVDANFAGEIVELRVHGVSGTPPAALLGMPVELIAEVSGDNDAGFYQPRVVLADSEFLPQREGEPITDDAGLVDKQAAPSENWKRLLQAYSWGGLTSGPASRALWLLFLPFILVNLAHWMLPPVVESRRRSASAAVALLRLIGLTLTLTLMLAVSLASMDIIGWQCAAIEHCGSHLGPVSFMTGWPPGRRVALCALPVLAIVLVLWHLGHEQPRAIDRLKEDAAPTTKAAENPHPDGLVRPAIKDSSYASATTPQVPEPAVTRHHVPLAEPYFWSYDVSVLRLRVCHVTAWLSGLGALALIVPVRFSLTTAATTISLVLLSLNGIACVIAILTTGWNRATGRGGRSGPDSWTSRLVLLRWISLGLTIISLAWVAFAPLRYVAIPSRLPGLDAAIWILFAVQVALVAVLWVAVARCRSDAEDQPRGFDPSLRGYTAPMVAVAAWLIGGGFSVGVGLLAARFLGQPVGTTKQAVAQEKDRTNLLDNASDMFAKRVKAVNADAPLIVPQPYLWVAAAVVALLLAALAVAVTIVIWVMTVGTQVQLDGLTKRDGLSKRDGDYPGMTENRDDPRWKRLHDIARVRAWASLADSAPRILGLFVLMTVISAGVVVYLYVRSTPDPSGKPNVLVNVGVFITAGFVVVLATIAVQAYRDRKVRRIVAILWDVVTFWPRANHPLTPPCYGERAVPELSNYLKTLTGQGRKVIVVAHSQGTIIGAAALLFAQQKGQVALLTFGSPLRRLYAQNFPAYFSHHTLSAVHDRPWINMWALTDPIGSWVFDSANRSLDEALRTVDWRLLDVGSLDRKDDGTFPAICGHSGFWTRDEYERAFAKLQGQLLPDGASATLSQNPAPPTKMAY